MTCICGESEPHDPPIAGCLAAIRPRQLYQIPAWVRRAETIAWALARDVPESEAAQVVLAQHVAEMLRVLEAACGGRS